MKILAIRGVTLCTLILACVGCHPRTHLVEVDLNYTPSPPTVKALPKAFQTEENKEVTLGTHFADDGDYYRAITCYKRALFALNDRDPKQKLEIEYRIFLAYMLGERYCDALEFFETSTLPYVTSQFPAFRDLLLLLYTAYEKTEEWEKASDVHKLMQKGDPETATTLSRFKAFSSVDFKTLKNSEKDFFCAYLSQKKSVSLAQNLNALIPGAGYLYVGQKQTALTSFLMNALFIAATYDFFSKHHYAAGFITLSLETGWYIGGINGAGLAAKHHNQCLYHRLAMKRCTEEKLFPLMQISVSF